MQTSRRKGRDIRRLPKRDAHGSPRRDIWLVPAPLLPGSPLKPPRHTEGRPDRNRLVAKDGALDRLFRRTGPWRDPQPSRGGGRVRRRRFRSADPILAGCRPDRPPMGKAAVVFQGFRDRQPTAMHALAQGDHPPGVPAENLFAGGTHDAVRSKDSPLLKTLGVRRTTVEADSSIATIRTLRLWSEMLLQAAIELHVPKHSRKTCGLRRINPSPCLIGRSFDDGNKARMGRFDDRKDSQQNGKCDEFSLASRCDDPDLLDGGWSRRGARHCRAFSSSARDDRIPFAGPQPLRGRMRDCHGGRCLDDMS
ncbi:hypothetical protein RHECNPAF_930081 [Rhizobium etli CNPAF512]|nr:hypothetical protein RHECNPAF_930081 [Rhizobium etli CNPAF512]